MINTYVGDRKQAVYTNFSQIENYALFFMVQNLIHSIIETILQIEADYWEFIRGSMTAALCTRYKSHRRFVECENCPLPSIFYVLC